MQKRQLFYGAMLAGGMVVVRFLEACVPVVPPPSAPLSLGEILEMQTVLSEGVPPFGPGHTNTSAANTDVGPCCHVVTDGLSAEQDCLRETGCGRRVGVE